MITPPEHAIDLGHDHAMIFTCWDPDRALNPQFDAIASEQRYGASVWHKKDDGEWCPGAITFDTPTARALNDRHPERAHPLWQVESYEPLTISPSLQCRMCPDHGFIKNGQWVPA
jgi:hypothetical protein